MKRIMILFSLLMFLPLTTINKPSVLIMRMLFTDVTGAVSDAEEIARKAGLFRRRTGVAPFIMVLSDTNNETSLRQNGRAMLAHAASPMSNVRGSVLLLLTTREPQLITITNGRVKSNMDDRHLGLLVENHTLTCLRTNLWYRGIGNALAILQAQILE